jgi:hypothetical protein
LKAVEIPVESVKDKHISESVLVNVGIICETAVFTFFPEEILITYKHLKNQNEKRTVLAHCDHVTLRIHIT